MVPADSRRIPRAPRYSGYCWIRGILRVPASHRLRGNFPDPSASIPLHRIAVLLPRRCRNSDGLGFSPFARHYWGNHSCFLFLEVLRCFSSLGSPHQKVMPRLQHGGLSHSEIPESTAICASTGLIAAYHVLLRLQEPRHPPCALHILPVASPLPCTHIAHVHAARHGGSIYIRLFDFCSTLNFSACNNMSMNAHEGRAQGLSLLCDRRANRRPPAYGSSHTRSSRRREGDRTDAPRRGTGWCTAAPERRCSSRTFRYGYLVTT